jgi:purine-binding chemotaxis protein CheW
MDRNPRIEIAADEELQLSPMQVRAILADRATKLARAYTQPSEQSAEHVGLIAFSRGVHRYGIELAHLTEIRPLESWTPVPGIPEFFLGVIALRGEIVAVIDIALLFGGATPEHDGERFAVVVSAGDVMAALLADSVDDVHDLLPEQIHPPLTTFTHTRERYIRGLTEEGIALLDVEKLLGDEWLRVSQEQSEERR